MHFTLALSTSKLAEKRALALYERWCWPMKALAGSIFLASKADGGQMPVFFGHAVLACAGAHGASAESLEVDRYPH